jgi:hypothetical protein
MRARPPSVYYLSYRLALHSIKSTKKENCTNLSSVWMCATGDSIYRFMRCPDAVVATLVWRGMSRPQQCAPSSEPRRPPALNLLCITLLAAPSRGHHNSSPNFHWPRSIWTASPTSAGRMTRPPATAMPPLHACASEQSVPRGSVPGAALIPTACSSTLRSFEL